MMTLSAIGAKVAKTNFLLVYAKAHIKALSKENIISVFIAVIKKVDNCGNSRKNVHGNAAE
jgi:hypothetical protein